MDLIQKIIERGRYVPPKNTVVIQNKVLEFISTNAYWVCLFVGLGGLLAYMCGYKKGSRLSALSIVIYWVVAAVCSIE